MTDEPSNPPAAPTLEDLLKDITRANCHEETSNGPAVGREYGGPEGPDATVGHTDQTRLRELLLAGAESVPGPTADAAWFDGLGKRVKSGTSAQLKTTASYSNLNNSPG